MSKNQVLFATITTAVIFLSACAGASTPQVMVEKPSATPAVMMQDTATPDVMMKDTAIPDTMMHDTATPDVMMKDTVTPDVMMKDTATPNAMLKGTATPDSMMAIPAWYGASLNDVATGKAFTINALKGKVVLVESMSQACSSCKAQQSEVKILREKLGMQADFVSIGLDIDPKENSAGLRDYVMSSGFDWLYAISPANVSSEIASLYGNQFLSPTSSSILIIDRHGNAHVLPVGFKQADDLYKLVDQYLKDGM